MSAMKTILKNFLTRQGRLFGVLGFLCLLGSLNDEQMFSGVIGSARAAIAPALQIGDYVLISKRKASHKQYDYTYKAAVSNSGPATANHVKAQAMSLKSAIKLIDRYLQFGRVAAGRSVLSRDTFTLRMTENTVFNPADLQWQFNQPFAPTANAGPDQSVPVGSKVYLDGSGSGNDDEDEEASLHYF